MKCLKTFYPLGSCWQQFRNSLRRHERYKAARYAHHSAPPCTQTNHAARLPRSPFCSFSQRIQPDRSTSNCPRKIPSSAPPVYQLTTSQSIHGPKAFIATAKTMLRRLANIFLTSIYERTTIIWSELSTYHLQNQPLTIFITSPVVASAAGNLIGGFLRQPRSNFFLIKSILFWGKTEITWQLRRWEK
jgi:hypothetical protein